MKHNRTIKIRYSHCFSVSRVILKIFIDFFFHSFLDEGTKISDVFSIILIINKISLSRVKFLVTKTLHFFDYFLQTEKVKLQNCSHSTTTMKIPNNLVIPENEDNAFETRKDQTSILWIPMCHLIDKMKITLLLFFILPILCLTLYHSFVSFAAFKTANRSIENLKSSLQNDEKLFSQYSKQTQETFEAFYKKIIEDTDVKLDALYREFSNMKNKFELNDRRIGDAHKKLQDATCSLIPEDKRFDCHPESGASESTCTIRNCCWKPVHKTSTIKNQGEIDVPYCYYNVNWKIYDYENLTTHENGNDVSGFLKLSGHSTYKNDLPLIKFESFSIDSSTLRVKLYDPSQKRYEPPWPVRSEPKSYSGATSYDLKIDKSTPGFSLHRSSNGETLFNSNGVGGFIFSNQFLQMSSLLPSHNIYGLGEHRTNLKLSTKWEIFTLFNGDQPPAENANLYGSHPFYLIIEKSGDAHGVLFLNSNAMDVILQPAPAITFRTIGGIFDIYFFMGPTPADVLKQYSEIIGKPFLPPYWSLGFHLCRYNYGSLEKTRETWKRTKDAQIPFDTQWNDIDYMDKHNDFTYDKIKFKELPEFVKSLHEDGMHYIPIIDAGISGTNSDGSYTPYDEGVRQGIFVMDSNGSPFHGKTWNYNSTVWPDFTNPKTQEYYFKMLKDTHQSFEFDGAWLVCNLVDLENYLTVLFIYIYYFSIFKYLINFFYRI